MQKRMRHSKFKNTGILFELLTRQVTADIIAGRDSSTAQDLLYRYFKENTELGKEWQLYNTLLTEKFKNEAHAERMLDGVTSARKKLNNKNLINQKFNLIKEVKEKYSLDEMLKTPLRNYKLLASIYKIFEDAVTSDLKFDIKEIYKSKTCIIEHISNKVGESKRNDDFINQYREQSEDIRLLTYKLLVEKFNERYSETLDSEQKSILREYICNVANSNKFGDYVKTKALEIKDSLTKISEKIDGSDVIKIKLNEVVNQLDKISPNKIVKDNHVMVLMLSYELLKECKNVIGNKGVIR